jgi:GrpB-like predicted nucleotidyltransferase (UPF0157 family)
MGSTSVPGLEAKPIVDIEIFVSQMEPLDAYRIPLENLGYRFIADPDTPALHFFPYPAEPPRKFHVHVAEIGGWYMTKDLAVRDYLRANPDARDEYARVKREVTQRFRGNAAGYFEAKSAFMTELVSRAMRWALDQRA